MHLVYLISVWVHILAVATWLGGMAFLVLVVVPWLRKGDRSNAVLFLRETGIRFRNVGWSCFGLLLVTGVVNLWFRGVRTSDFANAQWLSSSFGKSVVAKLLVFLAVLGVSAAHDFWVGPRASAAIEKDPRSPQAQLDRRRASLLGRLNVVLALILVALGVTLVRGAPW